MFLTCLNMLPMSTSTSKSVEPDQLCCGAKTTLIVSKVNLRNSRPCSQLKRPIYMTCFCKYVQHEHQNI